MSAGHHQHTAVNAPPRYLPDVDLPPYAYVPGRTPHPTSDPQGHSYGQAAPDAEWTDSADWRACRLYLRGIDLFNHGFYWEAHEAWEALWHACRRAGGPADFFKGLIKLAAAGVKAREGRPEGVRRHARRAAALFEHVAEQPALPGGRLMGLSLGQLRQRAAGIGQQPPSQGDPADFRFPWLLLPEDD